MKIFEVLKKPKYLILAFIFSMAMLSIYIYSQVLGVIQNIDVWFSILNWYNALFLAIFTILFGITFSFQVYLWFQPKTCSVNKKVTGSGTSSIGTIGMFLVAQCPACAYLGTLFLPLSALTFLGQYNWLINLVSIGLLLFTLNYLGAFKK